MGALEQEGFQVQLMMKCDTHAECSTVSFSECQDMVGDASGHDCGWDSL